MSGADYTGASKLTRSVLRSALTEDAVRAVAETDGKRWKGRALSVELANERKHFKLRAGVGRRANLPCLLVLTTHNDGQVSPRTD